MNHIYRSIWNATLGCWVAGPENARAAGSRSTSAAKQGRALSTATRVRMSTVAVASLGGVLACTMAVPAYAQAYTGSYVLSVGSGNEISSGNSSFTDTSSLNALVTNAVRGGYQHFFVSSSLNASAENAVSGGEQYFNGSSSLNASAANAVRGGTQQFIDTTNLNASAANAVNGGTQQFYGTSNLNASAENAVSGGTQQFFENSSLNALVTNAVSGGRQEFSDTSSLNASAANAVNGGTQQFYGTSNLNASAENAVSGGTQLFFNSSSLNASAENAVSGGTQLFFNSSSLNASAANAVSGGTQQFYGTSILNASAANAVSGGTQQFFENSRLNASAENAVSGGRQEFSNTSSLNASAANAVSGGTQYFSGSSSLNASAENAVSGGTQYFSGSSSLNASAENAVRGGTQQFIGTTNLNASAANAVRGGNQYFFEASSLNASAANAVSGGTQVFFENSRLNASAANAVSGGTQQFYGTSNLNASAANTVSGGTQVFFENSRLNASAENAVSGGTQQFYGTSNLNASAANAVSGGTQQFFENSSLNASAANAVSGGELHLFDNAAIKVNFENALSNKVAIYFQGLSGVTGTHSNQLQLNGYSTAVGALQSEVAGAGVIVNNGSTAAVLTVDSSERGDSHFSGVMNDGTAKLGLVKAGVGTLTLSGASTFTGGTVINGGTLVAANASALGLGNVTVGTGAALEVTSGTALTVGGNLDFQSGSGYRVYADPNSTAGSRIDVTGTATLAGSVLHVGNESNGATDFQVGTTYTILTATSINGRFQSAKSNYAYLNATLGYLDGAQVVTDALLNATDVTLTLNRKAGLGFADLANTPNQGGTANAIESLPSTHALYRHIETLPAGTPAAVFNSLSGDAHASMTGTVNMLSAHAPNISQQHLRSNMTAGFRPGAPIAQSDGPLPASAFPSSKALPAWVEVVGHWQKMDGNSNAPGVKQNTTGLFLGADEEVGNSGWRVGGSVGYTNADAKVSSRDASADISSYSAAVYGGKGFSHGANRINVIGGLAYTKHSIESERSVATLNQNLKADYRAHTAQLFAEVGYAMGQYDKQGFEPFVGITLGEQRTNSFKESGGFAALSSQSSRDTLASTTLGVRAHSDFVLAGKDTRVRGTLGVRHAWGNLSQNRTMAFEGSSSFTVAGAPLARNTALVGLQAEMALSRYSALVLGYNGEYGSGSRDQSASVKVRWAF